MLNETLQNKVETVNKSSAACAAFNEQHKNEIDLGLIFPQAPTAEVLKKEEEERKREAAGFVRASNMGLLLVKVVGCKAEDVKFNACGDGAWVKHGEVTVRVEQQRSSTSSWSTRHSGWKMVFKGSGWGRNANKQWKQIGDGTDLGISDKQLLKCKAALEEVVRAEECRTRAAQSQCTAQQRKADLVKDPVRVALLKRIMDQGYVSEHSEFAVTDAGLISRNESFTDAQWVQICDLRDAQRAAMKQLKDSFKVAAL